MKNASTTLRLAALAALVQLSAIASAQSTSSPAILQIFEARWDNIENRVADIHNVGYGRLWVPPPAKASGGGFSVGYDVFDRFDLGDARDETRYGTSESFRAMIEASHKASVGVNPDLIWNHNAFSDYRDTNLVNQGGYPGFAITLPGDINGDFHSPFATGDIEGRISGLNDIDHDKVYSFYRHPTEVGNPNNIPSGTVYNQVDPNNARFYPDMDLGGTQVIDGRGNPTTLYDFNATTPLAGDPVMEGSLQLLMRNVRWMIQEYDIDGFRMDATKHFEREFLQDFDTASFLAKREPLLDGSPNHVYSFGEAFDGNKAFLQEFVRKDIDNNNLGTVGGNRDSLDFSLFFALRDNLTGNGLANNWHSIRSAHFDQNDDGLINGSQGVTFVNSHDSDGAFLNNVAYAYTLMLPTEAIVYMNADAIAGETFPEHGRDDALGGFFGDAITTLVGLRNTHGRGDFKERWVDDAFNPNGFSNIYVYERSNAAVVGLNSRNDGVALTRSGVQTDFATGTVLVELTGNASDPAVDPTDSIPDSVVVNGSGQIDITVPANASGGRGYVIYGVAGPQGSLSVTSTGVIEGTTGTSANFGTARLADIEVITDPTFTVRLETDAVSLPNPNGAGTVRDVHADGDTAIVMIDGGIDLNGNGSVDNVTPGSVSYGFEEFVTTKTPGYQWNGSQNIGTGEGVYEQVIDTTTLSEGRHYITARAFRHRNASTGGDGGPAVFTDFKQTIYVDLLPPDSAVESFEPFASSPGNPDERDLIIESIDQTADRVHVFLDLPANLSEEDILAMVDANEGQASYYDRDRFVSGQFGVTDGSHTVTIVTIEETGTTNIQRETGFYTETNLGLGFGDLNSDNQINPADVTGPVGFETVLYSQNDQFNAAADVNGDGLVDNVDLFLIVDPILEGATDPRVAIRVDEMLQRRADVNDDGVTDEADMAALFAGLGSDDWLLDIDGDGVVELEDAQLLVTGLVRSTPGDFNLDGVVDGADYTVWRDNGGSGLLGDADFDGDADAADLAIWQGAYGSVREDLAIGPQSAAAVPEPTALSFWAALFGIACRRRNG